MFPWPVKTSWMIEVVFFTSQINFPGKSVDRLDPFGFQSLSMCCKIFCCWVAGSWANVFFFILLAVAMLDLAHLFVACMPVALWEFQH